MRRPLIAACLIVTLLPEPSARAGGPPADAVALRHCTVDYEQSAQLGPPSKGVIQECLVKRGDRVKTGQVLCRLFDDDVRAEAAINEIQAKSDLGVRMSKIKYAQAQNRLKRSQRLFDKHILSTEDFEAERIDTEQARMAVEEAKMNLDLAQLRLRQSLAQTRSREFISPFDGVVVDILKYPGESVTEGEVVIKVVSVDRLRVTGFLNVSDLLRVKLGQPVQVGIDVAGEDLPIEHETFTGRVDFLDSQIDPATRTCKVIAEVSNRDGILRSGFEAHMEILPSRRTAAGGIAPASPVPTRPATPSS